MNTRRFKRKNVLFAVTRSDAQEVARDLLGRELTDDEIPTVKELLERGLEGWFHLLEDAIIWTHAVNDPWFWVRRELRRGNNVGPRMHRGYIHHNRQKQKERAPGSSED